MGSGLGWLIKDYVEDRNGRIHWYPNVYLFLDSVTKRAVRLLNWKKEAFDERTDVATGRKYSLFRGRGAQCFHPDKWSGQFPYWSNEGHRAYFIIPQKHCRACEFHEPAKRRRRYAACRWFRENSQMPSPLHILNNAVKEAAEIMGKN